MSFQISQEDYQNFLSQALNQDQSQQSEEQQRDALITQGSELVEQAKQSAIEAGSSLLPLGTIELAKSVGALYEKGNKAYKAGKLLKKQMDEKTAKVEKMKSDAYDKAVQKAKDEGTAIPEKEAFMSDIDATLREKQLGSLVKSVKTAVLEKARPFIDEATNKVTNTIEALGATAETGINRLQNATQDVVNVVADNFGKFKNTASKYQENYTAKYNEFKDLGQDKLDALSNKLSSRTERVFGEFKDAQGNITNELKGHYDAVTELLKDGSPKALAQADGIIKNVSSTIKASKGATKITELKTQLDDVVARKAQKVEAITQSHAQRMERLNADKEALQGKLDKLSEAQMAEGNIQGSIGGLEDLGATTRVFRGSGFAPSIPKQAQSAFDLRSKLDIKTQQIAEEMKSHAENISAVEEAHLGKITELQNSIRDTSEQVAKFAGDQAEGLLSKAKSAFTAVKDGVTAVKSAVAPVTEVIGTALAPLAVFQGATSAEALIKGEGIKNATDDAQNLIGVKFGFDAAKGLVQQGVTKVKGLLGGEQEAQQEATAAAEKTTAAEVEESATKEGASILEKSAGKIAGEDIAEQLGKEAAEKTAEEGVAAGIGSAIPVVGEVLDAGLALFSVIDGIKNLFDKPKAPAPPPPVTSAVSFVQQRGVY